jgi:hypothetical protein
VRPRLADLLGPGRPLYYVGRDEAASPATGNYKIHQAEEAAILARALQLPAVRPARSGPGAPGDRARQAAS